MEISSPSFVCKGCQSESLCHGAQCAPSSPALNRVKGEVRTLNERNICERRSCMKNNGKSPTFKFVSGEERRPEVQ